MAQFKIDGRLTVKNLKDQFKKEFNCTLRVYDGNKIANDSSTLASIRDNHDVKSGSLTVGKNWKVDTFEQKMYDVFGVKVKVFTCDDWVKVLDNISLGTAGKIKKGAVRADMEPYVGL